MKNSKKILIITIIYMIINIFINNIFHDLYLENIILFIIYILCLIYFTIKRLKMTILCYTLISFTLPFLINSEIIYAFIQIILFIIISIIKKIYLKEENKNIILFLTNTIFIYYIYSYILIYLIILSIILIFFYLKNKKIVIIILKNQIFLFLGWIMYVCSALIQLSSK